MIKVKRFLSIILSVICILGINPIIVQSNAIIAEAATKIAINKTSITLKKNQSYQLKITGTNKSAKWKSSNSDIVSVNSKGKIFTHKKGNATITATVGDKKLKCNVTVKNSQGKTYYWVKNSKVYHSTKSCPTLSRSKNIQSGKLVPSDRRGCKKCC